MVPSPGTPAVSGASDGFSLTKVRSRPRRSLTTPESPKTERATYPHQAERLTESLERGRLDVLVATSLENAAYVTGFNPSTDTRPAPALGIYTRQGVALVVPVAHVSMLVDEPVDVDHIVCIARAEAPRADSSSLPHAQFLVAE